MSAPDPAPNPIDPAVAALIRRKARRLTRQAADADDLEQDLVLALLRRLPRFDPARGHPAAFARLVVGHAAADLRRRRPPPRPAPVPDMPAPDATTANAERAADVAAVVAALPPHLRALADALAADTLAAAARALGVPRSTLQGWAAALRRAFAAAGLGP